MRRSSEKSLNMAHGLYVNKVGEETKRKIYIVAESQECFPEKMANELYMKQYQVPIQSTMGTEYCLYCCCYNNNNILRKLN